MTRPPSDSDDLAGIALDPDDEPSVTLAPSRANALILAALGAGLVAGTLLFLDAGHGGQGGFWVVAFKPFIGFLAIMLIGSGMGLAMRSNPAFADDRETISMPYGMMALHRVPWEKVRAWGIVRRRIPWLPFLRQKVFAVWLEDFAGLPRMGRQEVRVNRLLAGADLILSDWFLPAGFDLVVLACRRIAPEKERAE